MSRSCPDCPPFVPGASTKLGVFIRNYLEPSTDVGPPYGELAKPLPRQRVPVVLR